MEKLSEKWGRLSQKIDKNVQEETWIIRVSNEWVEKNIYSIISELDNQIDTSKPKENSRTWRSFKWVEKVKSWSDGGSSHCLWFFEDYSNYKRDRAQAINVAIKSFV